MQTVLSTSFMRKSNLEKKPKGREQVKFIIPTDNEKSTPIHVPDKTIDEIEDMIDLGLALTFPASDPPAWKRASSRSSDLAR